MKRSRQVPALYLDNRKGREVATTGSERPGPRSILNYRKIWRVISSRRLLVSPYQIILTGTTFRREGDGDRLCTFDHRSPNVGDCYSRNLFSTFFNPQPVSHHDPFNVAQFIPLAAVSAAPLADDIGPKFSMMVSQCVFSYGRSM